MGGDEGRMISIKKKPGIKPGKVGISYRGITR
jgi:hypothetical protein